jgi:hypothetical protein
VIQRAAVVRWNTSRIRNTGDTLVYYFERNRLTESVGAEEDVGAPERVGETDGVADFVGRLDNVGCRACRKGCQL